MAARNYRRQLLVLYEEDKGFGTDAGKKPAGFTKIETRGGKGLLTSLVQNLKDLKEEGLVYKGFIASTKAPPVFVSTGTIPVDSTGKGESKWRFDPANVANTGHNIDRFDLFGIRVYRPEGGEHNFICPLAGGRGELPKNWKEIYGGKVLNDICPQGHEKSVEVPAGLAPGKITRKEAHEAPDEAHEAPDEAHEAPDEAHEAPDEAHEAPDEAHEAPDEAHEAPGEAHEAPGEAHEAHGEAHETVMEGVTDGAAETVTKAPAPESAEGAVQENRELKQKYQVNTGIEDYLQEVLRFYQRVEPFEHPDANCHWWRINSYDYLFGTLYGGDGRVKYYAYGIPGIYQTQTQMQMEAYGFCRWQPKKGSEHTPGDLGYWLAFVDAKTGVLANPG